uniref:Uncharacterized protein n=1 Tax=Rhipicephalus zambeziensis TaxID=60191 RepID=A0A224YLI7_9ACAR
MRYNYTAKSDIQLNPFIRDALGSNSCLLYGESYKQGTTYAFSYQLLFQCRHIGVSYTHLSLASASLITRFDCISTMPVHVALSIC